MNKWRKQSRKRGFWPAFILQLLLVFLVPGRSGADGILDVLANPDAAFKQYSVIFPNWQMVPAGALSFWECADSDCAGCAKAEITSITIVNYGTASGGPGGDLVNLYFAIICGMTNSGIIAMSYAGDWLVEGVVRPAWVWTGSVEFFKDPCDDCSCYPSLFLYADVGPCPTDGATVELGPGYNSNEPIPGGIWDSCFYAAPWGVVTSEQKTIRYVMKKADREVVSPGDTVGYRIYYSRPGTGDLSEIQITDSIPDYMHWCDARLYPGCGPTVPMPDASWDPQPGPPMKLRWTIPGPLPTAGGATGEISFSLSVDWGNSAWDIQSGEAAAPENSFLFNSAHMSWQPQTGCAGSGTSNTTMTVVQRYLFWMLGDNDVLFSPRIGYADDIMTYEVFVKNVSAHKTWWNVVIWDTVPPELVVWDYEFGFEDPCAPGGWTMTPTGCAMASPGSVFSPGGTILTWRLDMPPGMTSFFKWRAKVNPTVTAGIRALNRGSIMALGNPDIINGTGHATNPRSFLHEAYIALRTIYTSYVAYTATSPGGCDLPAFYFISFYPLNKFGSFSFYTKFCCEAPPCDLTCADLPDQGGVSPTINVPSGGCDALGSPDWEPGCTVKRAPARYVPAAYVGDSPDGAFALLHKVVSNSPMIWELSSCLGGGDEDASAYAGTTNLTFAGMASYAYCRILTYPDIMDSLYIANTSESSPTTLFIFSWNPNPNVFAWQFYENKELYNESQYVFVPAQENHYRIVSSAAPIMVHKSFPGIGLGGSYNDFGTSVPNRENGNLTSNEGEPAVFYLWAADTPPEQDSVVVGNIGDETATYEVWRYAPFDTSLIPPSINVTSDLVGSAGSWIYLGTDTVPPGDPPGNPHVYGPNYDQSKFKVMYRFYKVKLLEGGPVQMFSGRTIFRGSSGGAVLHASEPPGAQVGTTFWLHLDQSAGDGARIHTLDVFCPRINQVVQLTSNDGYLATYETNEIDQCVLFLAMTGPDEGERRNFKLEVLPVKNFGDVVVQYNCSWSSEKFFSAPFLSRGVYYDIFVPVSVFSGQSFWITVVVMDSGGATKTDYCSDTYFTSSDPRATMPGDVNSEYEWSSDLGCPDSGGSDNGVRLFQNVVLDKIGVQSIVAVDIGNGMITGLATLTVVGADVKFTKEPRFLAASSGETVQFRICWSNYSSATAFGFTITDAVPVGTALVPELREALICGVPGDVGVDVAYSANTSVVPPNDFATLAPGGMVPGISVRWLRWTVKDVGVSSSGCVCFKVKVN